MRAVYAVMLILGIIELAIVLFVSKTAHITWTSTRILGLCLLLFVLAWVVVARIHLGRSFSVTPQARKLITNGIYSRIRNPIYVASPFLLLGLSLTLTEWWPLLLIFIVVSIQIVRARREAKILHAAFGNDYDHYRARTWF